MNDENPSETQKLSEGLPQSREKESIRPTDQSTRTREQDSERSLENSTISNSLNASGAETTPRDKARRRNQQLINSIASQIPLAGLPITLVGSIIMKMFPEMDIPKFFGKNIKDPIVYLTFLSLKLFSILLVSLILSFGAFIICYCLFPDPKEFHAKVPFQKNDLGLTGLFFLKNQYDAKSISCAPRTWSYTTYPKENLEILEKACQVQEGMVEFQSLNLEPYNYIVEVVLDLPTSKGNDEVEFLELKMTIIDSIGQTKAFHTTGTHITSGNSIMRTIKQLYTQHVDKVFFNSKSPVLKNEENDLLILELDIWEKSLAPEQATIILHPVLSKGIRYYMTYYFWPLVLLGSCLVFWMTFLSLGSVLLVFEVFFGSSKSTQRAKSD